MLCLSGFELYSRWVPLVSVAQQEIASFINTCGGTPLYGHPLNTDTRFIRTVSFVRQKAHIFSLKLTLFIRTPANTDNGHFSVSRVTNSHVNPALRTLVICTLSIFIVTIM